MLTVGDKFPEFKLKATVAIDSLDTAFDEIDNDTYKGKWTLVFFYPKDFTFVCPTEIKGFGDLNAQFRDRDCQVLAASTDTEFVHLAWRKDHKDLRFLPFPMLADTAKRLSSALGILDAEEGVAKRATFLVDPEDRRQCRPQSGRGAARAGCLADRRALPVQLEQGRRNAQGGLIPSMRAGGVVPPVLRRTQ
jgi:peroxiredoxin (alkyl hydroperoxide reductase subunit C)